ncbi:MAG: hypothetical protein O0X93_03010 [Methanocorpusculum sp.]|nr:hypothetical protein [Methanocorpusculum sp.]
MDSGDPVWTALFVLVAIGIVLFFAIMIRRNLSHGSCCCGCSKSGKKKGGCCHCKEVARHSPLKK